jgi:zinc and cadmium transporter
MPTLYLTLIYCALMIVASLGGGWIPLLVRLTHRRMQISISFVAGVMLGVGLLIMLPHALMEMQNIDRVVVWTLVGFLSMFFLERFFHFHHHDAPDDNTLAAVCDDPHHDHTHDPPVSLLPICDHADAGHDHHAHDHGHKPAARFSWTGALVGMTVHSLVDGMALAAAIHADTSSGQSIMFAGLGTFLAVIMHKPFDSLAIGTLMSNAHIKPSEQHMVNLLYAFMAPLGVGIFFLGSVNLSEFHQLLGIALSFAAGAFVCIATSDLLPELHFHSHDRGKLSIALLLGIAMAWGISRFEGSSHSHSHSAPPAVTEQK